MNVLILTPDRVGSTLLQRLLTIYMLRKDFGKPIINLHELTNGVIKYYNTTLNQEVLGKPNRTEWGYFQTLDEVIYNLKSIDHYVTSRLAHYHILARKDPIDEQMKFYEYLNSNFYIISCRRNNLFEHALSWVIQGHSKQLNVYSVEEKINHFYNIYKDKITVEQDGLNKYLQQYKDYIAWSDTYFNIQSYFYYDKEVQNIEKYILNLDFMSASKNNSWEDMFGQSFDDYNACHRHLPNLICHQNLENRENNVELIDSPAALSLQILIDSNRWKTLQGADWPAYENLVSGCFQQLPTPIYNEIETYYPDLKSLEAISSISIKTTKEIANFLNKNITQYKNTNAQLAQLVKDGFLVTSVPIKLQSLSEKQSIIKNFDQCIEWYNIWVNKNNFGEEYSKEKLAALSITEDAQLNQVLTRNVQLK